MDIDRLAALPAIERDRLGRAYDETMRRRTALNDRLVAAAGDPRKSPTLAAALRELGLLEGDTITLPDEQSLHLLWEMQIRWVPDADGRRPLEALAEKAGLTAEERELVGKGLQFRVCQQVAALPNLAAELKDILTGERLLVFSRNMGRNPPGVVLGLGLQRFRDAWKGTGLLLAFGGAFVFTEATLASFAQDLLRRARLKAAPKTPEEEFRLFMAAARLHLEFADAVGSSGGKLE